MGRDEFIRFFLASDIITNSMPPSLYDFVLMFEMLDTEHTGMISAQNLRQFMETAERLRAAKFNVVDYEKQLNDSNMKKKFD
eukprot:CAMPEP_0202965978 /NCGR_PEP_ID=MMETSP1396-20130829/10169_1 /ASSEMBLY_ACC=CAM_ASM_000872 /TAXON_ID= /ORGANISM="Pseudokeronopsis sp., Strain Brazil" /LENGTH=81 /DNA_ID=CAMNT_0049689277 /DNA_START=287 /DNA_END=532 /DNA_ORIENTATION=-